MNERCPKCGRRDPHAEAWADERALSDSVLKWAIGFILWSGGCVAFGSCVL